MDKLVVYKEITCILLRGIFLKKVRFRNKLFLLQIYRYYI